jgi:hypothetical protein
MGVGRRTTAWACNKSAPVIRLVTATVDIGFETRAHTHIHSPITHVVPKPLRYNPSHVLHLYVKNALYSGGHGFTARPGGQVT